MHRGRSTWHCQLTPYLAWLWLCHSFTCCVAAQVFREVALFAGRPDVAHQSICLCQRGRKSVWPPNLSMQCMGVLYSRTECKLPWYVS